MNLVDRLIDFLTNSEGLSNDEAAFKRWLVDISEGKDSDHKLTLRGEWDRRINVRLQRLGCAK
ncbi:hypothetical protein BJ165DRAFT_1505529 [Panaeolus papilionaceus]|nr:hypothetical protein BJ165DRAFT_1505529 [Panaeolus papilionaceus]